MIIVGEKINGTRKHVGAAIAQRDKDFIVNLALSQQEAGVDYLDIHPGSHPEKEPEDMVWLVKTVQSAVEVPLCLDSANPNALTAGLEVVNKTPIINSLSGEKKRIGGVLPVACKNKTELIVLALDEKGIPGTVKKRLEIIRDLVAMTREGGLPDKNLYIDPLVTTIATDIESGNNAFNAMRQIRKEFPDVHITAGLSNISFGLPLRSVINQAFVVLAIAAGMDSAILDPQDRKLRSIIYAAELVLGRDRYCMNYTRAYRAGKIGGNGR